jgi:hypothetical protein
VSLAGWGNCWSLEASSFGTPGFDSRAWLWMNGRVAGCCLQDSFPTGCFMLGCWATNFCQMDMIPKLKPIHAVMAKHSGIRKANSISGHPAIWPFKDSRRTIEPWFDGFVRLGFPQCAPNANHGPLGPPSWTIPPSPPLNASGGATIKYPKLKQVGRWE